jgi:hypothetical protein
MKTTWPKGVRDITTIQELRSRSVPSSREQIIIRLARLEHEKARRTRERAIWTENQQQADARLRATQERVDHLQAAFEQHEALLQLVAHHVAQPAADIAENVE